MKTQILSPRFSTERPIKFTVMILLMAAVIHGFASSAQSFDIHHLEHENEREDETRWLTTRFMNHFTGGEFQDVLLINVSRENERAADLYSLLPDSDGETAWRKSHSWTFDEDVIGFDVVQTPDGVRLLVARVDSFYLLDLDTMEEELILELPAIFRMAPYGEVPTLNLAVDLNDDELSDLAIPDFDGYWIAYQTETGKFDKVQKLPVKPGLVTGMAWSYRPRMIYQLDYDGDGFNDMGFWDRGDFLVYRGLDEGYETERIEVDLGLDLQVDESIIVEFSTQQENEDEDDGWDNIVRSLYQFEDINDDGITDAVVLEVSQKGLFNWSTTYDFHFGSLVDNATVFNTEPDTVLGGTSIFNIEELTDLNNDGNMDIVTAGAKISLGAIIRFFLTRSFGYRNDFYIMRDGKFSEKPDASRTTRVKVDFSNLNAEGMNLVTTGDLNGDGLNELVVSSLNNSNLKIYNGIPGGDLFSNEPVVVELGFKTELAVSMRDINDDGRDEILINRENGLTCLVSR